MVPPLSLRRCANSSGGFPPTPTPLHCSSASAWSIFLPLGLIPWPTPTAPVCALVSMEMPFLLNCPPRRPHSLPNPLAQPEGTCPCAVLHPPPDLWMLPKDLEDLHLQSLRCRICTVRYAFERQGIHMHIKFVWYSSLRGRFHGGRKHCLPRRSTVSALK